MTNLNRSWLLFLSEILLLFIIKNTYCSGIEKSIANGLFFNEGNTVNTSKVKFE